MLKRNLNVKRKANMHISQINKLKKMQKFIKFSLSIKLQFCRENDYYSLLEMWRCVFPQQSKHQTDSRG